jgi:putative transcriptional regulator
MATSSSILRGTLLLAAPTLRDPNFARTVLYLAAHTAKDGAFGYILNRPLDKVVSELMPTSAPKKLAKVPVFLGGPVGTDKLSFASLTWNKKRDVFACKTHLSVDDAADELRSGNDVRAFVGYSGWSEGQLEKELKHQSWIIAPPPEMIVNNDDNNTLWNEVLTAMGPRFALIAETPEKPELN